jgi:hypothetical protein
MKEPKVASMDTQEWVAWILFISL